MLKVGITGEATTIVNNSNTAATMGSGTLDVFATPALVALMEGAAAQSVEALLEEGQSTVGASLKLTHSAPSPLGATISCSSTLTGIEGRKLVFEIEASDAAGKIGSATHERFIIDKERFMQKASERV